MIPLSVPNFEGNEEKYAIDAVSQGWVSTGGAYVERMEEAVARYVSMPGAVACQSGTAALHLALIVVHVFGNMADMEAVMGIAGRYGLKVIEDATEALGTYYEEGPLAGRMAGSIGDFGAYSFNGNKIITTGGGGMLVGQDTEALSHLKYLSTQAKDDPRFYIHDEVGYNYRMTNVQAALGVAQMEELEEFIARKNKSYRLYRRLLEGAGTCHMLGFREGCRTNKWFYSLMVDKEIGKEGLHRYIHELEERGVQTRPIWGLIHEQKPYRGDMAYRIEKAQEYSRRVINLPCSTNITEDEVRKVAEQIIDVIR